MTKKDYLVISAVLKAAKPMEWSGCGSPENPSDLIAQGKWFMWKEIAGRMCTAMGNQNPKFDRTKFMLACGGEAKK